ncbi:MAG: NAD(P)/FAD-dependent oxidoreductase [Clostridia bacterium]|nr:NAD(P)/FAD-dependent oxidoreductase [Clostridia bacterium]
MTEVIVIGGGAAGMMAALQCALSGGSVTLLEGNEKLGKKVYITGKGRCNLTNDCTLDEFMQQVAHNPRFLYSALNGFTPQDMMSLLEENGCPVVVQRGRRVFPATEKASDVTRTLTRLMQQAGVKVRLNTKVQDILVEDGQVQGVITRQGERLPAGQVILATGGQSYPVTGSDGDGYRLAEKLGHTVLPPTPVLSALVSNAEWVRRLQGLSLKNVTLTLQSGKKRLYREQGEMLFTHFGISGPLVLEMSCHLPEKPAEARVELNLKPALTPEQLDARLQREFAAQNRKQLRNVLPSLLPGRLAEEFPALAGVSGDAVCGQITKEDREKILHTLQCLIIPVAGLRPLAEAIVTRGGVSVKEVTPSTMESKLVHGLYFAGELLDVDAHTGGYNLQIAWSTGAAAGRAAAAASFAQE